MTRRAFQFTDTNGTNIKITVSSISYTRLTGRVFPFTNDKSVVDYADTVVATLIALQQGNTLANPHTDRLLVILVAFLTNR